MCLYSKVKELRVELLGSCKYAINHLEISKRSVTEGWPNLDNQPNKASSETSPPLPSASTASDTLPPEAIDVKITDTEVINSFMILIHGILVQEW